MSAPSLCPVPGHCVLSAPSLWLFRITLSCLHQHWLFRITLSCLHQHCGCSGSHCCVGTITVTVPGHGIMSAPSLWLFRITLSCLHQHWLFRITLSCLHHHCDCSGSHCVMSMLSLTVQVHTVMSTPTLFKVTQHVPSLWLFKVRLSCQHHHWLIGSHSVMTAPAVQSHIVWHQHQHWPWGKTVSCQHQHWNYWRPHWHAITVSQSWTSHCVCQFHHVCVTQPHSLMFCSSLHPPPPPFPAPTPPYHFRTTSPEICS